MARTEAIGAVRAHINNRHYGQSNPVEVATRAERENNGNKKQILIHTYLRLYLRCKLTMMADVTFSCRFQFQNGKKLWLEKSFDKCESKLVSWLGLFELVIWLIVWCVWLIGWLGRVFFSKLLKCWKLLVGVSKGFILSFLNVFCWCWICFCLFRQVRRNIH